jgi:beta-N-acetylglucosaminidase-like protein
MRKTLSLAMAALAIASSPLLAAPRGTWWVVRSPNFDSRVSRELEELAKREGVALQFSEETKAPRPRSPRSHRGELTIVFRQAESPDGFMNDLKRDAASPVLTEATAREGYVLDATYLHAGPAKIQITAISAAGYHHALRRIPDLLRTPPARAPYDFAPQPKSVLTSKMEDEVRVTDYPSFSERGIVEGFYGKAWSDEDRMAMMRFEGAHGMNVYYYAPKDDPYHRKLWREPYPPAEMERLGTLVETAKANFVDFCFAISPGLSMTYSSDADFATLTNKLSTVGKLGVNCFALFLDDVPQDLQNPADKSQFKTLAQAHVTLINKLHAALARDFPGSRLVVTPTVYTNEWGSQDYIRELGRGVDQGVSLVWTGPKVISPTIAAADAEAWGAFLHRKPLVWDNFPVNDGIGWRLNLGPMRGRDANLPSAVEGLVSNPMNQARASEIPLETVAEYLWNSAAYKPDLALLRAVTEQYGKSGVKDLGTFLKTFGDYWWDENIFNALFVESRKPFNVLAQQKRAAELARAVAFLHRKRQYRDVSNELAPFPPKLRSRIAEVMKDPAFHHGPGGELEWQADYDTLKASRVQAGFQLDGDFTKWRTGTVYEMHNRTQIFAGQGWWRGPEQFSVRYALGWDEKNFYVGVDVSDSEPNTPYTGRDIAKGDAVILLLETAFRKNFNRHDADGDEYRLLFSPGDLARVSPSVFSDQDYLPPRPVPRDFDKEIRSAWKKTATGFSGDIAIPAAWFDDGPFRPGFEIGIGVAAQKAFPSPAAARGDEEEIPRIVFRSKADHLFQLNFGNPASYQRLILEESSR